MEKLWLSREVKFLSCFKFVERLRVFKCRIEIELDVESFFLLSSLVSIYLELGIIWGWVL
jgi:hypothetical protein